MSHDSRSGDPQADDSRAVGKTMLKRLALYRDRWTSYGRHTGIEALSDKLSVEELRQFEIFRDYDDRFLERLSPDVSLAAWKADAVLFEQGTYVDLAFFIVAGSVDVFLESPEGTSTLTTPIFDADRTMMSMPVPSETGASGEGTMVLERTHIPGRTAEHEITFLATLDFDLPRDTAARLGPGELFGEIGAMSGWPQSVTARTATPCQLLQIRVNALRLMKRKSKALKERLDRLYRERALFAQLKSAPLFRHCHDYFLQGLQEAVELVSCDPGEVILREGEPVDALFVVRSGFVKLTQRFGEGDLAISYLSKGMTLGEVELLIDGLEVSELTATSVEYAELVKVPRAMLESLLEKFPDAAEMLWKSVAARVRETNRARRNLSHAGFTEIALDRGLVQGNSMLVIDLEVCTRCDDCVRACAATHDGRPRFVREGDKIDHLLIPKSCYHCRDPVCLVGCPTGAIHRAGIGAVVEIDDSICIGCSTCANNCPYDAIMMHETGEKWPADMVPEGLRGQDRQVASKCDLCHDKGHDPACVSHCPQGCAYRVSSVEEIQELLRKAKGRDE